MRVNSLFGLLAGAALLGVVPGEAAADLRTNASGRWQYVSALGAEYGRLAGQPAMLLQSGSTLASLVGAPSLLPASKGEDEDNDDEKGGFLSSAYVIVLAGVGGGAYLASELIGGGGSGGVGDPNSPPTSGGPNTPTTPTTPTDPTGGTGGPSASPGPTTPETTTPEPVTMTLLATGLAGLGGAQFRRRRKSSDIA
jgi:hypothetical protein